MSSSGLNIVRVFLFRIDDGDRRKFKAKANDTDSGGGPRDLRIRPEYQFWPFFERLLPEREDVARPRTGGLAEILVGKVCWSDGSRERTGRVEIWPHQNQRLNECRIAKVSQWGVDHLIEDDPNGGLSVLMLFQQEDGVVRLFFTTETVLRTGNWDSTVKDFANKWLDKTSANSRSPKSAFLDLQNSEIYTGD
ncbi:MAG: hypothetical protein RIB30_15080 [Thalassospira sp.]|uniref:hypothetical protein n=1 Tax=Thalassospira sp. TaxID=1912094 RepID=UPI0032EB8A64